MGLSKGGPTRYVHIRKMGPDGNGGKKQVSEYAATVAFVPDKIGATVGVALCSPKDQFNRKRGRQIAEGRAAFNRYLWWDGSGRDSGRDFYNNAQCYFMAYEALTHFLLKLKDSDTVVKVVGDLDIPKEFVMSDDYEEWFDKRMAELDGR